MAGEVPKVEIEVDVSGTEKLDKVERGMKKVNNAQKELNKQARRNTKAFKEFTAAMYLVDVGLGHLTKNIGRLTFTHIPLIAAIGGAGLAMGLFSKYVDASHDKIRKQNEALTTMTSNIAEAGKLYDDLTEHIINNLEYMERYGITVDSDRLGLLQTAKDMSGPGKERARLKSAEGKGLMDAAALKNYYGSVEEANEAAYKQNKKDAKFEAYQHTQKLMLADTGEAVGKPFMNAIGDWLAAAFEKEENKFIENRKTMESVLKDVGISENDTLESFTDRLLATAENYHEVEKLLKQGGRFPKNASKEVRELYSSHYEMPSEWFGMKGDEFKLYADKIREGRIRDLAAKNKNMAFAGQYLSLADTAANTILKSPESGEVIAETNKKKNLEEALKKKEDKKYKEELPIGVYDESIFGKTQLIRTSIPDDSGKTIILNSTNTINVVASNDEAGRAVGERLVEDLDNTIASVGYF